MLRDCRVVILGSTCKLCGRGFKCQTDLTVHLALKHRKYGEPHTVTVEEAQCTETEGELCKIIRSPLGHATSVTGKHFGTKLHKKLRITLRIGEEVVAETFVKKKHLKISRIDMCTQTEPPNETELVMGKGVHESVLSRIDPPVFGNSPYQCYNSIIHKVISPNRYLASDIISNKQAIVEKDSAQVEPHVLNRFNESCVMFISEKYVTPHVPSTTLLPGLNSTHISENWFEEIDTVTPDKNSCDSRFSEKFNPIVSCTENDTKSLTKDTNRSLEQIVQPNLKDNKEPVQETNINPNGLQNDISMSEKINLSRTVANTVQLVPLIISPIIVPNKNEHPTSIELPIQRTPLPQEQVEQHQQRLHQTQQNQRPQHQEQRNHERPEQSRQEQGEQQIGNTSTINVQDKDNEIQEVLRIVRGRSISTEINHESPNRLEQRILVQDAITDMRRMEEEGWHLLEMKNVGPVNRRKRSAKCDVKTAGDSEDCVQKKKRMMVKPKLENNVVRGPIGEKCISDKREHVLKMQNYNNAMTVCSKDSLKENLMIGNTKMGIPSEMLCLYGINYDNEVFEINNNADSLQDPICCFPAPCSARIENRSNRPFVIDLVNDTDE